MYLNSVTRSFSPAMTNRGVPILDEERVYLIVLDFRGRVMSIRLVTMFRLSTGDNNLSCV